MPLAFKTSKKQKYDNTIIEDGFGNYLEIPFYGCMTPNEHQEVSQVFAKANEANFFQIQLEAIAVFLRNRFRDPDITWQELNANCPTQPLIENLYEFMQGEKNQWEASTCLAQIKGEEAEEIARNAAKQHGGVCATTKSLKIQKTWFVFQNIKDVPENYIYDINKDVFCEVPTNNSNITISPKSLSPSNGIKYT